MKVWAGLVCAVVFAVVVSLPAMVAAHEVTPRGGLGPVTNYVGTPAGIAGAASGPGAGTESAPATEAGRNALEIPEPAVIALFGLVALAVGHRLRRAKA